MKRKVILVSAVLLFCIAGYAVVESPFLGGKTLSVTQVEKKWGVIPYSFEKFKLGGYKEKAQMASSIMKDKKLIGLDIDEVRSQFGMPDGFYFIDTYPAYIIQDGLNSTDKETWQIVFKLNEKYKVREIIVHKNCCYN